MTDEDFNPKCERPLNARELHAFEPARGAGETYANSVEQAREIQEREDAKKAEEEVMSRWSRTRRHLHHDDDHHPLLVHTPVCAHRVAGGGGGSGGGGGGGGGGAGGEGRGVG